MTGYAEDLWESREWRDEALAWVDGELDRRNLVRTGSIEHERIRPWSAVFRLPTDHGPVWLKAASRGTAAEVALYPLIHAAAPESLLSPLGVDGQRGWLLLPDGGTSLRDVLAHLDEVAAFEEVFREYAVLQIRLANRVDALLGAGVADMRPSIMPRRFSEALRQAQLDAERLGSADDHEMCRRVADLQGSFSRSAAELATSAVPASLDHNDLHDGNVFVSGVGERLAPRFFDWGDAVVAHPFATLMTGLGMLRHRYAADATDSRLLRVRDAYLEPFTRFGARGELVEAVALACRLNKVARCLGCARAMAGARPDGERDPFLDRSALEALGSLLSSEPFAFI